MSKKVLVGLSGGVDSSVAVKLLLDNGYDVAGVTLKLLSSKISTKTQDEDILAAKSVADDLGVQHFVYDVRDEFKKRVVDYFVESYATGQTPNPCFVCNRLIKFGLMLEYALSNGFDFLATGHYARIQYDNELDTFRLFKGVDLQKDQSYFLGWLNQFQLSKTLFPLGNFSKSEVRAFAKSAGLKTFSRGESQDICFVENNDYVGVINKLAENKFSKGQFKLVTGEVIGEHKGLQHYTIGQRRGLDLAFGYPVYVVEKDAKTNTVVVGKSDELLCSKLRATNINFINPQLLEKLKSAPVEYLVRTRYRQQASPAVIRLLNNNNDTDDYMLEVKFKTPERAVTPGQALVVYDNDEVLAGGIIQTVEKA